METNNKKNKMKKQELDKPNIKGLNKSVDDNQHKQDDARKYGKRIAQNFIKKYKATLQTSDKTYRKDGLQTDEAAEAISEMLYHCYMKEQEVDCAELLNEWIHKRLWGKIVMEYIPKFKEIWEYLHNNKYTKNNKLGYGDIDGAIWVEYPKQEEKGHDNRKIIIHNSYCTCANDNTHIFILNEQGFLGTTLHVRTVYPRENLRKKYRNKEYSIHTYRKRNFELINQHNSEEGYVLTLTTWQGGPTIERAQYCQSKIQHAIGIIEHMKLITTDESYQCK